MWAINSKNNAIYTSVTCALGTTLFPISEFVLDEKFQGKTSKFSTFYGSFKNPKLSFPFFRLCAILFLFFEVFCWNFSSSTLTCIGKCSHSVQKNFKTTQFLFMCCISLFLHNFSPLYCTKQKKIWNWIEFFKRDVQKNWNQNQLYMVFYLKFKRSLKRN